MTDPNFNPGYPGNNQPPAQPYPNSPGYAGHELNPAAANAYPPGQQPYPSGPGSYGPGNMPPQSSGRGKGFGFLFGGIGCIVVSIIALIVSLVVIFGGLVTQISDAYEKGQITSILNGDSLNVTQPGAITLIVNSADTISCTAQSSTSFIEPMATSNSDNNNALVFDLTAADSYRIYCTPETSVYTIDVFPGALGVNTALNMLIAFGICTVIGIIGIAGIVMGIVFLSKSKKNPVPPRPMY